MSNKTYNQIQLDNIKKRQMNELNDCPKAFFQLLSFMEANLRKEFKSFSLLNLCHGSSHKLRFNDPAFQKAFGNMMIGERLDFYERAVKYGIAAFGTKKKSKQVLDQQINEQISQLLPQGHKQVQLLIHEGFRSNDQVAARIQKFKISSRSHLHINLQNYILRESKKKCSPQIYILEAINKSNPERVRFSFVDTEEEIVNFRIIQQLAELAFQSSVNSMILSSGMGMSPGKGEKRSSLRKSLGRLAEPLNTGEDEFGLIEPVVEKSENPILSGKQFLEFSRTLAQMNKPNSKKRFGHDGNIVDDLLSMKQPGSSQPQSKSNIEQQKESENIFNKVLQKQSDIRMPYTKNERPSHSSSSPIRGFVSSEVKEYTGTLSRPIKYKNVFEQMLPEFNLRELQPSVSAKTFNQLYMSTGAMTTISQHNSRPQRFQCRVILQNISLDEVSSVLINQQLLKRWNQCVYESQIKITLSAQNCLICYQKHKRYSTWFKERDYLFLRHVFGYKQCRYIADRSIQHNSFIPFQSIQRGYVRHCVTRLKEVKMGEIEVIVDVSVDHGGYLGVEKKKELNLNFLKQYEALSRFIKQQRPMLSKMPTYCNTEWNIDWIDETNDGSFPRSVTLKTQDFQEGSGIDEIGIDNIELQSEDFYSIQDQDQLEDQQAQPSTLANDNDFRFQTTQGFEQPAVFAKKSLPNQLVQQKQLHSEARQRQESEYGEMSTIDPEIVLDHEGYCILPQKYIKKKHPLVPKQNYTQQKVKLHENIVMKGDFVQNKDGGILLVHKAKIEAQNNVINFIMKTMRKNLLSGKSILSISLPVQIFREDSNTQRLCQSMTMGPHFLEKAASTQDPLQRMKLTVCFALSNSLMYFDIEKVFNPILGETYQGMIDGCPIYAQQVSHHPPITSLYFVGRGFKVYASLQAKVFLHLNSGDGINSGFYNVEFEDGHVIRFQTAPGELSGFTIGDRKYRFKDKMYAYDRKNSYFAVLNFDDPNSGFFSKSKWEHPDEMQGEILRVSPSFITKFQQSEQKLTPKPKQIQSSLSKMSGRWIHYLNFDGKEYYNIDNQIPYKLVNYEPALNSDARFREDLIYRSRNDLAKSQIYKENLQNRQRKDRKLREQYTGKKH